MMHVILYIAHNKKITKWQNKLMARHTEKLFKISLKIIEKAPYDLNGKFPSFFTIFHKMKNSLGYAIQIHIHCLHTRNLVLQQSDTVLFQFDFQSWSGKSI